MLRNSSIAAIVYGLLVFSLAGCHARVNPPQPGGGDKTSKAENARKQAEGLALNVVNGVAKSQAKAISEQSKNTKSGKGGIGSAGFAIISPQDMSKMRSEPPTPVSTISTPSDPVVSPANPASQVQIVAVREIPGPKSPPRPGSPAIIRERVVSSQPYQVEAEAEDDVLGVAQNTIEQRLAELDPPLKYRPSPNEIRSEFIRKDSRATTKPSQSIIEIYKKENLPTNVSYVGYDIEVTADQIRDLRTRERITMAFRVLAGLTFISLSCFLFLRADEWTKGYLTRWLACGAVALVGGAAAALCFV